MSNDSRGASRLQGVLRSRTTTKFMKPLCASGSWLNSEVTRKLSNAFDPSYEPVNQLEEPVPTPQSAA